MIPLISNKYARDLYIYAAAAVDLWPAHFSIEHENGGIIFYATNGLWEAYFVDGRILAFKVDKILVTELPNLRISTIRKLISYVKLSKGTFKEFVLGFFFQGLKIAPSGSYQKHKKGMYKN